MPSFANYAVCIAGDIDWETGLPIKPTSFVVPEISMFISMMTPLGPSGERLVHVRRIQRYSRRRGKRYALMKSMNSCNTRGCRSSSRLTT